MPQVIDLRKKKSKSKKIKTKIKKPPLTKIEWAAPEFTKHKKEKNWFALPAFIALIVIIIAIFLKNFLLIVVTILAAFVLFLYALKEPKKIKFTINGKGIQIDQTLYRYEKLKSFWIFYEPPEVKEISLRSKKKFMPYIKIPLDDQNPVKIRRFLLRFLPERKHAESVLDSWMRKAGY